MKFAEDWPEIISFVILVIGFVISLTIGSVFLTYLLSFLFGLMAGHFWHERRNDKKAPYFLIISGFVIGYTAGAYYGNRIITLLCFFFGMFTALYIHKKKVF